VQFVADRPQTDATGAKGMSRVGWVLTGFVGLFLLVDGGARLAGFGRTSKA
jgi:hypothetical protein